MGSLPTLVVGIDLPAAASGGPWLTFGAATAGKFGTGKIAAEATFVDVTAYVRSGSIQRGSSRSDGVYGRADAGRASVVLDNSDARFDPTNLSGPYVSVGVTQITPMRVWRIQANGVDLWRGFADAWDLDYPEYASDAVCRLSGTDGVKVLANFDGQAQVAAFAGDDTGTRIGRVLDSAGWPAYLRNTIPTGSSTVQATTFDQSAWSEILLNADTEIGEVYFDGSGKFTFRSRRALMSETRSTTSNATFGDAGAELPYVDVGMSYDDTRIANLVLINRVGGVEQSAGDAASQAKYMTRTFTRSDLIHESDAMSQDYADYVLALLKDGELHFESITVNPMAAPATLYPQVLGRQLGDRITVKLRPPGRAANPISRDCYIRGVQHTFTPESWLTTWTLQDATAFNFLSLNHATLGKLDSNRLGF